MSELNCLSCHACIEKFAIKSGSGEGWFDQLPLSSTTMILCPKCGNKRCPLASDHELKCTDSNAVGQAGSIYQ